jgi:hypothetical protein
MKFLLLINLLLLSLFAKDYKYNIKATVVTHNASIYIQPNEYAQKKENYFKRGDIIGVAYCNKFRWCKIKNGYIKQDVLNIKSYLYHNFIKPKYVPVKRTTVYRKKPIYTPEQSTKVYADKPTYTSIRRAKVYAKKPLKRLPIYPSKRKKYIKNLDHYDKYFYNGSSEVKINNSSI